MPAKQGYELVDHTADVGLRVWAPTCEGVFAEAGKALFSLICDPRTIEQVETVEIRVEADDRELLLAAWIDELIYQFEATGALFTDFTFSELDETHLVARASGEHLDPARHAVCGGVKAATLCDLSVREGPDGWEGFVILDV
ncbi:MAG TPA: archease [Thermoleophilia bacterium]|nr:archease [Thermoleophilia bacterium]HQJ98505.1 archease [Thermoleophilia bacterium]